MFQKNIEALRLNNKALADKLEQISIEKISENIEVHESESKDLIIAYNKIPLDSLYDPIRESKTIWNKAVQTGLAKNDIQVVFGMGLGYLFKRAYVNADSRILVYEPFEDVLRFVLEYIDLSKEIADGRVYVTCDLDEALSYIGRKYLANDKVEVLYNKSYAALSSEKLVQFSNDLLEVCKQRNFDSATVIEKCKVRVQNFLYNLSPYLESRFFSSLEGKFKNKTALIISAGPSLLEDIEVIKNNRSKFLVIAVGRALKKLLQHGIKPDFTVFMEAIGIGSLAVEGVDFKDLNLILDSCASRDIYGLPSSSKFIYCANSNGLINILEKVGTAKIKTYPSAGTVSIVSYFIAKELGCNKFIFSGLDLAFKNNLVYSDNNKSAYDKIPAGKIVKVKDFQGNLIETRDDYALFIRQLEEVFAEDNNENIYNTSSGALIKGMKYVKLLELVNELEVQTGNIDEIIETAYAKDSDDWQKYCYSLMKFCSGEKSFLDDIKKRTIVAKNSTIELLEVLETVDSVEKINPELKLSYENSMKLISEMAEHSILSNYIQGELLEYIGINKATVVVDMNKFKNNLKFYIKIFQIASEGCTALIAPIETGEKYFKI